MEEDLSMEILSTKRQIKDFKNSFVWKDMLNELKIWGQGFATEQARIVDDAQADNPSTASVLLHLGDTNGRIKAVNYMVQLPDIFLQILEDKENDAKC